MAVHPNLLVVKVVKKDETDWRSQDIVEWCNELCEQLKHEPGIVLASPGPLRPEGVYNIDFEARLLAIVLAGRPAAIEATVEHMSHLWGEAPVVRIPFTSKGEPTPSLTFGISAGKEDIIPMIHAAVAAVERERAESDGNVHLLPDRRPPTERAEKVAGEVSEPPTSDEDGETPTPPDDTTSDASLPVPVEDRSDVRKRAGYSEASAPDDILAAAMDWVEAATNLLVDLWADKEKEENVVYGVTWTALQAWLERLLALAHAPAKAANDKFKELTDKLEESAGKSAPLARLYRLLDCQELPFKLLLVGLAPEVDIRFQRLFGALHDDMGRRHVTIGLACAIVAASIDRATTADIRAQIATLDELRDLGFVDGAGDATPPADEPMRLDPGLVDWLLTGDDGGLLGALAPILRPSPSDAIKLIPPSRIREIFAVPLNDPKGGEPKASAATILTGSEPGWLEVEAAALAEHELIIGPPPAELAGGVLDRLLRDAIRASRLLELRLVIDMLVPSAQDPVFWRAIEPLFCRCRARPYAVSDNPARLLALTGNERLFVAALPPVRQEHRVAAIRATIGTSTELAAAEEIAERFRLPLALLPDVPPLARAEAAREGAGQPGSRHWKAAFRSAAGSRIPQLARRVPPRSPPRTGSHLDRVVLPPSQRAMLETIVSHVQVGGTVLREWQFGDRLDARGVSALFTGESGTGKTTAAHAIASQLGADLYVIDLARIVSKYIGETEKNLDIVFTEAERAGAALLFDEADALFGKRSAVSDAHDRYANIEVAYLLQRMELFDGLVILTTNHPRNIDPAFGRRLRFTVEFPFPAVAERQRIWEQVLPADSRHRGPEVHFALAARRLEVNGGSIRQIVLHALMAAAARSADGVVRPQHLEEAAHTELVRLAKHGQLPLLKGLFATPIVEAA